MPIIIENIEYMGDVYYGPCLCGKVIEAEDYEVQAQRRIGSGPQLGLVTCPSCCQSALLPLMIKTKETKYIYS